MDDVGEGVQFLRVANGGSKTLRGRYAGDDYFWGPGDSHDISVAAARHIFGFGDEDKSWALNRLGLMRSSVELESAMSTLRTVTFTEIQQVFRLPKVKKVAKQLSNDRSLVNAGGADGDDALTGSSPDDPADEEDDAQVI